jgi:hypothetical protein
LRSLLILPHNRARKAGTWIWNHAIFPEVNSVSLRQKVVFFLGALGQWLLFRSYVTREVAWTYPVNWDQCGILARAYGDFDSLLKNGPFIQWFSMWAGKEAERSPNGVLQAILASILFLFGGATRETALSVNLLCYIGWQVAVFAIVLKLTKRIQLALIAWGLVLSINSPFLSVSGMMDFRYDFSAMCLFGIWMAVAIWSGFFSETKRSIFAGIIGGFLILYRYLTAVYLFEIYSVFLGITILLALTAQAASARRSALVHRAQNILYSGLIVTFLSGPSLWASRKAMWGYYFDPRLDRSVWGASISFYSSLVLYARALFGNHIGPRFLYVVATLLILTAIYWVIRRRGPEAYNKHAVLDYGLFLVICLAAPLISLGLYPSKQLGVTGIMVPPIIGILLCAIAWLIGPETDKTAFRFNHMLLWVMAAVAIGYGAVRQTKYYSSNYFPPERRTELTHIVEMYDQIGNICVRMNWNSPRISTDSLADYTTEGAAVLTPLYYERHSRLINVIPMLGNSVFHIAQDQALSLVKNSDIVLLSSGSPIKAHPLPFMVDMESMRPILRQSVSGRFLLMGKHTIFGRDIEIYARPSFTLAGISGDWMPFNDITISLSAMFARPSAQLVLKGPYSNYLPDLKISAELTSKTGEPATHLKTEYIMSSTGYTIRIILPESIPNESDSSELHIRLSFSKYFVPAEVGMGPDMRKLVLWKPKEAIVLYNKTTPLHSDRPVQP